MTLNYFKCNHLMPLCFKGLSGFVIGQLVGQLQGEPKNEMFLKVRNSRTY